MLVTGGAHRVGKAICMALAPEGAAIVFIYPAIEAGARCTSSELAAIGAIGHHHDDDGKNHQTITSVRTGTKTIISKQLPHFRANPSTPPPTWPGRRSFDLR